MYFDSRHVSRSSSRRAWASAGLTAAVLAARAGGVANADTLTFDFEDGTLQGWTNTKEDPDNGGSPTRYVAYQNNPEPNSPSTTSGVWQVAPQVSSFNCCPQDAPHDTLVLTSPQFVLDATGSITFSLTGGAGDLPAPTNFNSLPASSADVGFQGVGLRNVATGQYVLTDRKSGDDNVYQALDFSNAELAAAGVLDGSTSLVFDLIDAGQGGWGWVAMDSVTFNGATIVPEPASLALLGAGSLALLARRRRIGR
jgi:hypothetical protein